MHVGEWIDAKMPQSNKLKIPKGGQQWFSGVYLGKDTEADEVIIGNADGVFKVRAVKRRPPSQQWNAVGVTKMLSVPWQPKGDGVDSNAFVMPPDLGVQGRVKPPPGLSRVDEEEENEQLEDLPPGQTESLTVQELLEMMVQTVYQVRMFMTLLNLQRLCPRKQELILIHLRLNL